MMGGDTILGRLATEWSAVTADDVPGDAAAVVGQCLLDWLGCAVAGSAEPLARIMVGALAVGDGGGPSTIVGTTLVASARTAALVNGAAGHALDFDDTHTALSGHPTVPVLPAVLALAEELDSSMLALRTAFAVGVEVECRLGALLAPGHYRAGWHATGTLGTIGAAAACAHLLGLDPERTTHALALAATQAAGLKASFGTMAKPLHAGKAAADGLLAARLAAGGFTGNPAIIEAAQGLGDAAGGGTVPAIERLDRFEGRWLIRDTLFKYHAACYLTHASINAALGVRPDLEVGHIEAVEVHVARDSLQVCNIERPTTGLEGKFSLRATTAMALLGDDTTDMASYSDQRMGDRDLVELRERVTVVPDADRVGTRSRVVVITDDGRRLEAEDDTGRPAADLDLQQQRLAAKFAALASPVLGADAATAVREAALAAEASASVRSLTALLSA
ncbi:MAG TPA: MmgE/PrpD family protein [Acidimicrobiales bacterium]|nr:MmgE/PrpD family protein [Acidimicrobiales bacterium]